MNNYNEPYWQDETCMLKQRVISFRYNPNRIKTNVDIYHAYLRGIIAHLSERIKKISEISTFYDGSMCCVYI